MGHARQQSESPLGESLAVVHHEAARFYELMVELLPGARSLLRDSA